MANIAEILKTEMARLARKELRNELSQVRQALAQNRLDVAGLNRRVVVLEKQLAGALKAKAKFPTVPSIRESQSLGSLRFSSKGLVSLRRRLGVSAPQLAALLSVSAQSIYKWENGQTRPNVTQLQTIAALRKMGRKAVAIQLADIRTGES
ncbi:helix-turn-helix domain-containing protein [Polaromonas sp. P5_D5]